MDKLIWVKNVEKNLRILGRHFGCRPLDPTLDIWSNFVKKEKKKKKAFYLHAMSQGFPRVLKGY